jgi:pimeloyl-ACP methyl ester carboxylesterase
MDLNLRAELSVLSVPLLVVYGAGDSVITPSQSGDFDGLGRAVRVISMPDARHFPMLDQSSRFNRLLMDFLNSAEDISHLELKDEWQRRIR